MPALFEVKGLSKKFGHIAALSDVSFHVRAGEILGLIGPNGAGKSTLFECLAGVSPSDSGEVLAAGRRAAASIFIAVLCSRRNRSVARAIRALGARFHHRVPRRTRASASTRLSSNSIFARLLDQPIGALSKGQRKRVLLAIGLLTPQPALLIDEPFEGLDLRQARDITAALREHAAQGRTLFLSIHQISDAARFCDRFVLLNAGRVCGEGTFQELAKRKRICKRTSKRCSLRSPRSQVALSDSPHFSGCSKKNAANFSSPGPGGCCCY